MCLHPGFDWNILVIYRHTSALKGFRSGGAYLASHRPGILRLGGAAREELLVRSIFGQPSTQNTSLGRSIFGQSLAWEES